MLTEKEDGRMVEAATESVHWTTGPVRQNPYSGHANSPLQSAPALYLINDRRNKVSLCYSGLRSLLPTFLVCLLVCSVPAHLHGQTDCLACHADKSMQNEAGHSIAVDGQAFEASIHGSLKCSDCHADVKDYPHPEHIAPVQCKACHADLESEIVGSVHAHASPQPCTSCHGDAHAIFPKADSRSAVYPLNIARTCGNCHGNDGIAKKHGLQNVSRSYVDSIHGMALVQDGLLVAANCTSCHGSHHILSHKDPQSATFRTNVPATCGSCHAGIAEKYAAGVHGKALVHGQASAPVCTDCHTTHSIRKPNDAEFQMHTAPFCGSCHKAQFSTYHDTFHSQLSSLGGYVETARCWDCHGAHDVMPASDPKSPIAPANLVTTCSKCHAAANPQFVKYQPHANAHDFKRSPALFLVRLFMNLLLISVLTFFAIHTLLWVIRSRYEQIKRRSAKGGEDA